MTLSKLMFASIALLCATGPLRAETPTRVRGTITSVAGSVVHIMPTQGADTAITLTDTTKVTLIAPTTLADVKPGSFIGTAAKTQPDGTLIAVEVHVFPESMRGAGEGHRPFDLGPTSTMTNGTVGQEVVGKVGQTLTVTYKGGEKQVVVPPGIPVVTFGPGDRALLVAGAHVIAFAQKGSGDALTAATVLVGKDGLVPPM